MPAHSPLRRCAVSTSLCAFSPPTVIQPTRVCKLSFKLSLSNLLHASFSHFLFSIPIVTSLKTLKFFNFNSSEMQRNINVIRGSLHFLLLHFFFLLFLAFLKFFLNSKILKFFNLSIFYTNFAGWTQKYLLSYVKKYIFFKVWKCKHLH